VADIDGVRGWIRVPIPVPDQEVSIRAPALGRPRAAKYSSFLVAAIALGAVATPSLNAQAVDVGLSASTAAKSRTTSERGALVNYAKRFLGTPYRWGGASPGGFDCSGLTSYVYGKFGVRMPHYTRAQYAAYRKVARTSLKPGDLVFFSNLGHMGIYLGRGRFIHATHTGDYVRISKLSESWYARSYSGAVRPPLPRSASSTSGPSTRVSLGSRSASSVASRA
jgi:cell wall-associated NlpC family hydrolase